MKYYRVFARIDLDAIGENMRLIKERIPAATEIMAVVKADAYGHGAVTVAKYLRGCADRFGVASVEEALELRHNGITEPVLILGYTSPEDYKTIVENNISVSMFDPDDAKKLSETASQLGKEASVHIKVDTGMSRLGFRPDENSAREVYEISQMPKIKIAGIFSHYATADEEDKSETFEQRKRFDAFIAATEALGVRYPVKHLSNSAGTTELDSYYGMVRCGIIMYGLSPSGSPIEGLPLRPAMELCAKVIFVKDLEAGRGISYGHTFVTDRPMRVATVSLGYGDGYPRALSDKGEVLLRGKRCPILGRVCMDQLMIDVTDVPDVRTGDTVVAVGRDGEEYISAEEVSSLAGSFNYEFICGVSRRVPRVYIKDGKEYKNIVYIEANS